MYLFYMKSLDHIIYSIKQRVVTLQMVTSKKSCTLNVDSGLLKGLAGVMVSVIAPFTLLYSRTSV